MDLPIPLWAILVAAVGGFLVLLIIVISILVCRRRRSSNRRTRLTGDAPEELPPLGKMVIRRGRMVPAAWKWSLGASTMLGDAKTNRSRFSNIDDAEKGDDQKPRSRSRSPFSLLSRYDRPRTPQSPAWPGYAAEKRASTYEEGDEYSMKPQPPTLTESRRGSRESDALQAWPSSGSGSRAVVDDSASSKKKHWSMSTHHTVITEEDEKSQYSSHEPIPTPPKVASPSFKQRPMNTKLAIPMSRYASNSRYTPQMTSRSPLSSSVSNENEDYFPRPSTTRMESVNSRSALLGQQRSRPSTSDAASPSQARKSLVQEPSRSGTSVPSRGRKSLVRDQTPDATEPVANTYSAQQGNNQSTTNSQTAPRNFSRQSYAPNQTFYRTSSMKSTAPSVTASEDSSVFHQYSSKTTPSSVPMPPPPVPQVITTITAQPLTPNKHKHNKSHSSTSEKRLPNLPRSSSNSPPPDTELSRSPSLNRSSSKKGKVLRKKSKREAKDSVELRRADSQTGAMI